MTIVLPDQAGLDRLISRLDAGSSIVVPLRSPLPYVVVGTSAGEVNSAKGRPRSQPVGVGILSLDAIEPAIALDQETISLVRWLLFVEGTGVLTPIGGGAPGWLEPATVDGMAFLGDGWLPGLSALLATRTHLYMSSGNATTGQPAVTAAEAEATFGAALLVADGDALRDPTATHGSSTMITAGRDLALRVARPGINNVAFGDDHVAYLDDLRRRWRADDEAEG